jgi:hypothetical protein
MTTSIGGLFTSPPEIVSWGPSEINLFAFAVGTDQALCYAQLDGFTVAGIMPGADGSLGGRGHVSSACRAIGRVVR